VNTDLIRRWAPTRHRTKPVPGWPQYSLDVSNHQRALGDDFFAHWGALGYRGLIVQSVTGLDGYSFTRQQCQAALDHGWQIAGYVWCSSGDGISDSRFKARLELIEPYLGPLHFLALDVEEAGLSPEDVDADLQRCDEVKGDTPIYCVTPETRVLTRDLLWVAAGELREGDELMAFEEEHGSRFVSQNPSPRRLRDGRLQSTPIQRRGARRYQLSRVMANERRREEVFEIALADGTVLHATDEHRWLVTGANGLSQPARWLRTDELADPRWRRATLGRYVRPWRAPSDDYVSGYLAAAFDGEGSLYFKNARAPRLSFAQRDNAMLERVREFLVAGGYATGNRHMGRSGVWNTDVAGTDVLRLLGETRPIRLLAVFQQATQDGLPYELRTREHVGIESVRYLGRREIAALGTSSATYFAEGFGAHNTGKWVFDQAGWSNQRYWAERRLWDSNYDGVANVDHNFRPYGGWLEAWMKQFTDDPLDCNICRVD
jgi:hypothetical protein